MGVRKIHRNSARIITCATRRMRRTRERGYAARMYFGVPEGAKDWMYEESEESEELLRERRWCAYALHATSASRRSPGRAEK